MGCASLGHDCKGFLCGKDVVPCRFCGVLAEYLCDAPVGRGKTCDAPLCAECALPAGGSLDDLKPDDLAQQRDPESRRIYDRRLATMADLHHCAPHYAQAQRGDLPAPAPKKPRAPRRQVRDQGARRDPKPENVPPAAAEDDDLVRQLLADLYTKLDG